CLQLRLEEVLVDLSLIDRHALFDAHPDHVLPVETELLRQFFGREVIRHRCYSLPLERKNPPRATRWRARSHPRLSSLRTSLCPPCGSIHYPEEYALLVTDGKHRLPGFEERELEWRGTRLRYAVGGDGSPLVLVHGLGGTVENWRALAPALAARHRVLVADLPGHGRSSPLPVARDVDALAGAVLGIADAEEIDDAVWIGHTLGGLVALRAAVL